MLWLRDTFFFFCSVLVNEDRFEDKSHSSGSDPLTIQRHQWLSGQPAAPGARSNAGLLMPLQGSGHPSFKASTARYPSHTCDLDSRVKG